MRRARPKGAIDEHRHLARNLTDEGSARANRVSVGVNNQHVPAPHPCRIITPESP
jgi:hypothetical protein